MVDVITKYITDKKELSLAKELVKSFPNKGSENAIKQHSLESVEVHNFGNISHFTADLNGSLLVTGKREAGKSWFAESPLWCFKGSSRSATGVVGEDPKDSTYVSTVFKAGAKRFKLERTRKKGKPTLELFNASDNSLISDDVKDIEQQLRGFVGVDLEFLPDLLYYSPKLSFHFSKKLPNEIEEHLIKLTNNDIWLELGEYAKKRKKRETDRVNELNGIIGYISSSSETKEDLEEKIKVLKVSNKDLNKEIKDNKLPDIDAIKKSVDSVQDKIDKILNLKSQIDESKSAKARIEENAKDISRITIDKKNNQTDLDEMEKIKSEYTAKTEEMNDIVVDGKALAAAIKSMDGIIQKGNHCPIINIECDDLAKNGETLKKDKEKKDKEKDELSTKYSNLIEPHKKLKLKIDKEPEIKQNIKKAKEELVALEENNKDLDKSSKINVTALEEKKNKIGDYEQLSHKLEVDKGKYENFAKTMKDITEETKSTHGKISENNSEINRCEEGIKKFAEHGKFIKEKEDLDIRQDSFDTLIKVYFGKKGIAKDESISSLKKLNIYLKKVIGLLSNDVLDAELDDKFKMIVSVKGINKVLDPTLVSDGQEFLVNLAFVLATGLMVSSGKMPYFFCDDCFSFQDDQENCSEIINAFLAMKKEGMIGQLILVSNRIKVMEKHKKDFGGLYIFKDGKGTA